jgi:hypothetical protein
MRHEMDARMMLGLGGVHFDVVMLHGERNRSEREVK